MNTIRQPRIVEYLYSQATQAGVPLSGTFELSPLCNFSCKMCYVRLDKAEMARRGRRPMGLEDWLRIAEQMREMGTVFLLLTGGEPFLWPDFWPLYERLIAMGFAVSINSNGSVLDAAAIARLMKNPPQRLNITLYGGSDEAYARLCGVNNMYSRVTEAIVQLKKAGIPVKVNCSVTPENSTDLEKITSFVEENGLVLTANTYMFPPLRRDAESIGKNQRFTPWEAAQADLRLYRLQHGPEAYRRYLQAILSGSAPPPAVDEGCLDPADGRVRCRAGRAAWWITWDGYMTPCGMLPEPRADIQNSSFAACWDRIRDRVAGLALSGTCSSCENQKLCHACAAMAYGETGSFSGIPRYLCEKAQALRELARKENP